MICSMQIPSTVDKRWDWKQARMLTKTSQPQAGTSEEGGSRHRWTAFLRPASSRYQLNIANLTTTSLLILIRNLFSILKNAIAAKRKTTLPLAQPQPASPTCSVLGVGYHYSSSCEYTSGELCLLLLIVSPARMHRLSTFSSS